jgi:hypothetical protein
MPGKDLQHVASVQQRGDDTVVVYVQTDSFEPDQEVEVSVYLTQGDNYAFYNNKKRIPPADPHDPKQPAVLHVELPATPLDATKAVTVVTRVTEVWPTVLQQDQNKMEEYKGVMGKLDQGLKAVWTYQDAEGKGPGGPTSPPPGNGGSEVTTPPK